MRPSTLRPSILSAEGMAMLRAQPTLKETYAKKAAERPKAWSCGGTHNLCAEVICKVAGRELRQMLILSNISNRLEAHAEILAQLTKQGCSLVTVIAYGDEQL